MVFLFYWKKFNAIFVFLLGILLKNKWNINKRSRKKSKYPHKTTTKLTIYLQTKEKKRERKKKIQKKGCKEGNPRTQQGMLVTPRATYIISNNWSQNFSLLLSHGFLFICGPISTTLVTVEKGFPLHLWFRSCWSMLWRRPNLVTWYHEHYEMIGCSIILKSW
jgi:hypothetical protein